MQLSRDRLMRAYRDMRTIREFEERVHREARRGEIKGSVHLYAGEEASAVGVCMHLDSADMIASTHRGHGHSIAKGCDVTAMMCELYGREGGICNAKGGSLHIADIECGMLGANGIIGAGAPLACGAALTAKTRQTGGVAVAFIGDGGINQGATAESLNLATVWALPVVFVIEDNGYGEAMASAWATAGSVVKRAAGYGVARGAGRRGSISSRCTRPLARRCRGLGPATDPPSSIANSAASTATTRVRRRPTAAPARSSGCAASATP